MSGPRRYHYHANMAEPCEVPEAGRPLWREIAGGAIELGVFLLIVFTVAAWLWLFPWPLPVPK